MKKETTLQSIENAFSEVFPYLRLRFFSKAHGHYQNSHAKFLLTNDETLTCGALNPAFAEGEFELLPKMSSWELENTFEQRFGLHVQVFKQSGTLWLETTRTDDVPLDLQNERARQSTMSLDRLLEEEEEVDYREQE